MNSFSSIGGPVVDVYDVLDSTSGRTREWPYQVCLWSSSKK